MTKTGTVFDHTEGSNFHLSVLNDVSQIINFSDNFQTTLDQVVSIVSNKLKMDVCSIYLFNPEENVLTLQATQGLSPNSLGVVQVKLGEGVVSLVIEEMKPISLTNVQQHPRFINFDVAEEKEFKSFLGLPILDNEDPIGVLVVQKRKTYDFHINEINMLQVLAGQVSSVIQVARILEHASNAKEENITKEHEDTNDTATTVGKIDTSIETEKKRILTLKGLATSFGYGHGKVLIIDERYNFSVVSDHKVENIEEELNRFEKAVKVSSKEILEIKETLKKQISEDILSIFDSHLMLLNDPQLNTKIQEQIKKGNNASFATLQIIDQYVETFNQFEDPYIRDKAVDIEDIGRRIIVNLLGVSQKSVKDLPEPCIVVAKFLTPSTTANLDTSKVVGIVTEHGGTTSHASILARSLEIPAVIGVKDLLSKINLEDKLIVDGNTGFVFINPPKGLIYEYQKKATHEIHDYHNYFLQYIKHPVTTKNKNEITVQANIGMVEDVGSAQKNGAKSVGLFRTEFLYMTKESLPSMEEQFSLYKKIVESFPQGEVTIRTLDIGGDKLLPYLQLPHEENPCLGSRSTRFLLDHPKILFDQLKAILQASYHGKAKVLFPMISTLNELIQVKDFLEIAKGTLIYNGLNFNENIEVGLMIEVPSVIFQLDAFIPEVDFFSIGTNDLIQYLLAVDRDNEKVSNIYNPLHPAVLRAVNQIVTQIAPFNKRLTVCGEMAGTTQTCLALLALGIRDVSVSPSSIPYLHYLIQQIEQSHLDEIKEYILACSEAREVEIYLRKQLKSIAPKL